MIGMRDGLFRQSHKLADYALPASDATNTRAIINGDGATYGAAIRDIAKKYKDALVQVAKGRPVEAARLSTPTGTTLRASLHVPARSLTCSRMPSWRTRSMSHVRASRPRYLGNPRLCDAAPRQEGCHDRSTGLHPYT